MVQPTLIRETSATPLPHRTAGGAARRILLVKLDAIGDYLLFRETLRFLRNSPAYREAHITFLGNPVWRDLALAYDADCADEWLWLAQAQALLRLPHENLLPESAGLWFHLVFLILTANNSDQAGVADAVHRLRRFRPVAERRQPEPPFTTGAESHSGSADHLTDIQ